MKSNDFLLIAVVAIVSGVFSVLLSNMLFTPKSSKELSAQVVDPITADFQTPDKRYFNDQAINPTQLIQIGDSNNPNPF